MGKSLKTIIEDTAESNGWGTHFETQRVKAYNGGKWDKWKTEKYVEFRQPSPLGEDFSFEVFYDCLSEIPKQVYEEYSSFDMDEHVMMWLEAKRNGSRGIPGVIALANDAVEIEKMILDLAFALRDACGRRCRL